MLIRYCRRIFTLVNACPVKTAKDDFPKPRLNAYSFTISWQNSYMTVNYIVWARFTLGVICKSFADGFNLGF